MALLHVAALPEAERQQHPLPPWRAIWMQGVACLGLLAGGVCLSAYCQDQTTAAAAAPRRERALIVIGLAGDAAHAARFAGIADAWREGLSSRCGFDPDSVQVLDLSQSPAEAGGLPPAEQVRAACQALVEATADSGSSEGRAWFLLLGHATAGQRGVALHLAGPDVSDRELATWLAPLSSAEQVFWLTTAEAARFVRPLAKPGRVLIAATSPDDEFNETEFPLALAEEFRLAPAADKNQAAIPSTVWDLCLAVEQRTRAIYARDERLPTEQPQLDDNGDGLGTPLPQSDGSPPADAGTRALPADDPPPDGSLARSLVLHAKSVTPPPNGEPPGLPAAISPAP